MFQKKFWKQEKNTKRGKTDIIQYHLVKKANDLFPAHRTTLAKEEKEGGGWERGGEENQNQGMKAGLTVLNNGDMLCTPSYNLLSILHDT